MTADAASADDALSALNAGRTVIVGCGNVLRGDDAVGPILIRHLWENGFAERHPEVVLVDGGTAGMDVAFKMAGAARVVLIDASTTGSTPGMVFRVPAAEVTLPPVATLHPHLFRWDHALAFARWLLKDLYPSDVTVFLIEAASCEMGAPLDQAVEAAMHSVITRLEAIVTCGNDPLTVELTGDGHLRIDAAMAQCYFPGDALVAQLHPRELWLLPLVSPAAGGLLLKQRNRRGDRSVLVHESLPRDWRPGMLPARWDDPAAALRVALDAADCATGASR